MASFTETATSRGARITGWGRAVPDKVLTNDDLAKTMDTSNEWIVERTGIHERRVGGVTSELAVTAGRLAIESAGLRADQIDLLILATTTPDQQVPATSATVQDQLGVKCGAMDINAACSGFVYALVTAYSLVNLGFERILVIGADCLSRITNWEDRGTAILFADGGGAVVVEASDRQTLLGFDLGADGSARFILDCDIGGTLRMEGREVFKRAVRAVVSSAELAMKRAGVTADEIAWLVPHQANIRIIESAADKLGIPPERCCTVLHNTGNTSAGSIPLALVAAIEDGRIKRDDLVLMSGFGAGMTWASAVVRWDA
jgi:3-oxoacyl-[acyl-carrier-protein] synthase III